MQRWKEKSCYSDSNELKRMSMVSHARIAIGNTSVMFVLLWCNTNPHYDPKIVCMLYGRRPDRANMAPTLAPVIGGQ